MTLKSFFTVKIFIIPIIFSAGFLAGACWRPIIQDKVAYMAFVGFGIAYMVTAFFKNLPAVIYNTFHRQSKKPYQDSYEEYRRWLE